VIISIHLQHVHRPLVYACTIVSVAAAACLVRFAASMLPAPASGQNDRAHAAPVPLTARV
jgi:hypothetical protein